MPAPGNARLPLKAVIGLAISAVLLVTAVVLEIYSQHQRHAVITEQGPVGADDPILQPVPPDTPLPTPKDLAPETQAVARPGLTRPGMPPGHPGGPMALPEPGVGPAAGGDAQVARGLAAIQKFKCNTCHSLDGSKLASTSFKGLYGKHSTLIDGSSVLVDDAYIRESILNPKAKIVAGPAVPMPPFAGQITEAEIEAIIAYLKANR